MGFVVTNSPMEPDRVIRFYNLCGTAEQHIKMGKNVINWTRLSCKRFRDNEVRLQLHALAYNMRSFLKRADLPEEVVVPRNIFGQILAAIRALKPPPRHA